VGKEICFAYNEDTLTIVDVSDKAKAYNVSRVGYAGFAYTHQVCTAVCLSRASRVGQSEIAADCCSGTASALSIAELSRYSVLYAVRFDRQALVRIDRRRAHVSATARSFS
jgi:hypothetical protein